MAFWWGIISLIRQAPTALEHHVHIPQTPSRLLALTERAPLLTSQQKSTANDQQKQTLPQRLRPPFACKWREMSADPAGVCGDSAMRDGFLCLKFSDEFGRADIYTKFDGRGKDDVYCLTGSRVLWTKGLGSEEEGKWERS